MNRRLLPCPPIVFTVAFVLICRESEAESTPPRIQPNIVLILTDDQGWWDLGVHGNPVLQTPHMDQLSRDGVQFPRFYVSPVCSLTRASLLTGRYPLRTGCFDTRFGHDTLATSEVTIANVLKTAGYGTGIFGKWHQGRYMPHHPNHRGFDTFFGFWQYGHVERYFYPDRMWHNQERVECRGHITELITNAAIDFIASVESPFFCYVAYNVPHAPFQATEDLVDRYLQQGVALRDAQIYALIDHCDAQIGKLLKALDDRKLRDNTIVLFLSDNGGISRHYTAGFRGSKGTVLEGGIRTPFFVRYPSQFPRGQTVDIQGDVIDILPTLAELAGAATPTDRVTDGISLVPWLRGEAVEAPQRYHYHNWSRDIPNNSNNWAVQDHRYKLVNGQLFDVISDPGESRNLTEERPEIAIQLRAEYERWFEDVTRAQSYDRVRIEVGRADENPVELQMSWANLEGSATRYTFDAYDWDSIDGWKQPGDAAIWQLHVVEPGRYEVVVSYGCERSNAGGEFAIRSGGTQIQGSVEATPANEVFITRRVGVIKLDQGDAELRCQVLRAPGSQLMALNRIWLRRLP